MPELKQKELQHDEMDFADNEDNIFVGEYDITATPNDFNISTLFSLIDNGVIRMPPFQRNYVWDIKRASKLIESIILGLPVPQVFLYEQGKNTFFVIDGQQRLLSIYFFMKQRFPTTNGRRALREYLTGDTKITDEILSDDDYFTNFKLNLPTPTSEEKNKMNGLKFETLGEYKYTFEILRTIRSVVIKQNAPDNDSSINEIFSRLNTGGQNLSAQEIRMSLYYSDFYRAVINLNSDERWKRILNETSSDIRLKDVEILIRSLAMLCHNEEYNPPLNKFLNSFSKEAENFTKEKIEYLINLFESFLDSCEDIPTKNFLTNRKVFKISLFEAIFVGACENAFKEKKLLSGKLNLESIEKLSMDTEFLDSTQRAVASKKSVITRMRKAKDLIRFN